MSVTFTLPLPSDYPRWSSRPPTRRSCEVAAALGICLDDSPRVSASPASLKLSAGAIALALGPSGSGKSTFLRSAARALREQGVCVIEPARELREVPLIDQIEGSLEYATRALARAGLAEAACFVRRPSELSQGQRERLRLALAFERALRRSERSPVALALDEFCASLDGLHARAVAALLRRFVLRHAPRISALVATPRDELAPWLGASVNVHFGACGEPSRIERAPERRATPDPLANVRLEPGGRVDYLALAPLHYRAQQPATITRVLRAVHDDGRSRPVLAGALVVSMPALNARWRALAWPGEYEHLPPRERARRLNDEVRTISRVIVDPRFRSLGLAARLVRAYLRERRPPRVEAVAAMGHAAPFFERAGMRAIPLAPSARDARLLSVLLSMGVEPWRLATPRSALRRAMDASPDASRRLERALRRWACDSRATRALTDASLAEIFAAAARSVACSTTAYASG